MTWVQVLTPNPTVSCTPGWCLKYVSDAFGVSTIPHTTYPSATAAWNASHQHTDQSFPDGWVPVWFSLRDEPAGHVALRAPDGSVWSSSDPNTNVPHHHPSLAALIAYYANANPLTYLGWSEDIGGTAVIKQGGDMPEPINLSTARVLAYDALARDGFDGRPNALNGDSDDDLTKNHVGQPLTNQYLLDTFYSSPEAKNAITIKGAVYGTRYDEQKKIDALNVQLATEKTKSAGLAKNLDDSQLALDDANKQLAQAESLASDDDAKIKHLTAKLAAAQAQITELKTQAEKPPAPSTSTSTSTPPYTAPQPSATQTPWLDSLLRYLRLK